jgi:hypothetical protein
LKQDCQQNVMKQESHSSTTQGDIVTARRQRIEKKRELVNAQEELFGKNGGPISIMATNPLGRLHSGPAHARRGHG